jgi:hypothetical protein
MKKYWTMLAARERGAREDALKVVERIRDHPDTRVLSREALLPAWLYVEGLFPSVANKVGLTSVYKNDNTAFCKKIGIPCGVGGMFFISASTLLVCHNTVFGDDVIVVHEMLHYVSQLLGGAMKNRRLEEDFAYSNSINYLLSNGYDEKTTQEKYLLPYYHGYEVNEWSRWHKGRPPASVVATAREKAMERCRSMILSATGRQAPKPPEARPGRFDYI